jgi:hypothetical protein
MYFDCFIHSDVMQCHLNMFRFQEKINLEITNDILNIIFYYL